ncbi:hypothetical protein [Mycolicibacterium sphagni]|uniref:hypothetical protein n=1 Tax=Mycolicibacterium sphagni TaxID=1786 RepID=UPI001F1AAFF0|nr:hypothetical protein [Mycolicibacterium sphagni]
MSNDLVYAAEPAAEGTIFAGPLSADPPTSAVSELDSLFLDLGDVGEDGFTEIVDRKIDKKRNFGGKVVKVLHTEFGITYELVFLESLNADVLKAIWGASNVTVTPADGEHGTQIEVRKNSKRTPHLQWVIDTIDSELGARHRTWIPEGEIIDTGDVKIVHTDTIEYKVTIEAFESELARGDDGFKDNARTWTDDGKTTGS